MLLCWTWLFGVTTKTTSRCPHSCHRSLPTTTCMSQIINCLSVRLLTKSIPRCCWYRFITHIHSLSWPNPPNGRFSARPLPPADTSFRAYALIVYYPTGTKWVVSETMFSPRNLKHQESIVFSERHAPHQLWVVSAVSLTRLSPRWMTNIQHITAFAQIFDRAIVITEEQKKPKEKNNNKKRNFHLVHWPHKAITPAYYLMYWHTITKCNTVHCPFLSTQCYSPSCNTQYSLRIHFGFLLFSHTGWKEKGTDK